MDDIRLNNQIFVNKIRRLIIVGHDATHLGRRQKHIFRLFFLKNWATAC